jgi:hypothetical protein
MPPQVSVLWELGNAALRPALYFLAHPAAWAGLQGLCCSGKRRFEGFYCACAAVVGQTRSLILV